VDITAEIAAMSVITTTTGQEAITAPDTTARTEVLFTMGTEKMPTQRMINAGAKELLSLLDVAGELHDLKGAAMKVYVAMESAKTAPSPPARK
jgi:hypothetical protein